MYSVWNDKELVLDAIKSSKTRMEVLEKLERSPSTAMYRRLKKFERDYEVDTTHFKPYHTTKRKASQVNNRKLSFEEIFCNNSPAAQVVVKRRIIEDNLIEYVCRDCNNVGTWNNQQLVLQLEHCDGNSTNNTLSNLCFLCPNCHSQTKTYCGKNVNHRTKRMSKEDHVRKVKEQARIDNQPLVNAVLASGIDFSKYGWSKKVGQVIGKNPQKVKDWMMRYMRDFYINCCYHRANNDKVQEK